MNGVRLIHVIFKLILNKIHLQHLIAFGSQLEV
jgi:hypothetical protein